MRFEDAFCAYQSAKSGVVLGSGLSFLKASRILNKDDEVENVFLKSLEKPFETILENAGIEHTEIKKKIASDNFQTIYNVLEQTFEDTSLTKIIDPYLVLLNALENAVSIATMLLTTESLVLLEKEVINSSEM